MYSTKLTFLELDASLEYNMNESQNGSGVVQTISNANHEQQIN